MPGWLPWVLGFLLIAAIVGTAGFFAARSPRVRAFLQRAEPLGWRRGGRTIWLIARDDRVPRLVRLVPIPAVFYLLMPFDLIPDFIPVLGKVDDLLVVATALWVVLRFTPPEVVEEHLVRAEAEHAAERAGRRERDD